MVVSKNKGGKATAGDNKLVETVFEEFAQAQNCVSLLVGFQKLKAALGAENLENGKELYPILKARLQSWKCKSLWELLDAKAKHKEYGNRTICEELQVLVVGGGPIGLRTAIEVALLGAKVIVVEKRTTFGRNNVLHLWPFLIQDFRSLGAKRFYGKFCAGSLDHISIRILQCTLMKTALILGVQIYTGVTFEKMVEPSGGRGWKCEVNPPFHPASQLEFDMVIGADGKKNVLPDFPQIEMRGSLAIGITLNLVYHSTQAEAAVAEVSGLAYHFKPQFFDELYQKSGVRLENFVYYKNETHYFVMTAVKSSLLARGVLLMDYAKAVDLLAPQNINRDKLIQYALDAVHFGTEGQLLNTDFVVNDRGKPDIAMFDFTSLKKAEHAARIVERKGHRLLMALVGDSLIEPFWPTGSGCARGVLSALDTAWMLRSFAMDKPPLQVLSERESVYKLLSATTVNNLRKKFDAYTINPSTRYIDLNLKRVKEVYHLYDSDDPVNADFRVGSPTGVGSILENTKRRLSVTNKHQKIGRIHRKSSSDDLDEKNDPKSGRTKTKLALQRSRSRDLDDNASSVGSTTKKSKKSLKKLRSRQSSESADEKDVRARRRLGRTKSKDMDGSNNSLDTITESPKVGAKAAKGKDENNENSLVMKERSTKRWRLFSGNKPKRSSLEKGESLEKDSEKDEATNKRVKDSKKKETRKSKKDAKKAGGAGKDEASKKATEPKENEAVKQNEHKHEVEKKGALVRNRTDTIAKKKDVKKVEQAKVPGTANAQRIPEAPRGSVVRETVERENLRHLKNMQDKADVKSLPGQLRKSASERRQQTDQRGLTRSISHVGATSSTGASDGTSEVKRANGEVKRGLFHSLRRPKQDKGTLEKTTKSVVVPAEASTLGKKDKGTLEKTTKSVVVPAEASTSEKKADVPGQSRGKRESKRSKPEATKRKESVSVFDMNSLSPAARRTLPLLNTLTPEKKDGKYTTGSAISALVGFAGAIVLTTSLAIEGQEPLQEFQIERQRIFSSSKGNVKDKVALLDNASNNQKTRRNLSAALDNADGSPKPTKRFYSFSEAQRNVKQKLEDDSRKFLTLPRKKAGRLSLQTKMGPTLTDRPSPLEAALDILVKQYKFREIQSTFKIMLNMFRCISKDPDDETYRRVHTEGDLFRPLVWDVKEAKLFMVVSGWMEIGSFILFPKTHNVNDPIRVLMQNYRVLSEQQDLDTTCPQFLPFDLNGKHRRVSDDVFRPSALRRTSSGAQYPPGQNAMDDGKDTGSHSGSDSGMGFSETASDNNVPAVMATRDDEVAGDDVRLGDDVTATEVSHSKRAKLEDQEAFKSIPRSVGNMDPKKYLEDSYDATKDEGRSKLEPSPHVGNNCNGLLPVVEEQEKRLENESSSEKQHNWEILDPKTFAPPRSPERVLYEPLAQGQQEKSENDGNCKGSQENVTGSNVDLRRSKRDIRGSKEDVRGSKGSLRRSKVNSSGSNLQEAKALTSTLDALLVSLGEPMEEDAMEDDGGAEVTTNIPSDPAAFPERLKEQEHGDNMKKLATSKNSDPGVLSSGSGRDTPTSTRRGGGSKKNELDDLLDTLDFVSAVLEPPRVVYNERPPKQNRQAPRSTEASRRREQYTRSKLRGNGTTEERASPRPRRRARGQDAAPAQQGSGASGGDDVAGRVTQTEKRTGKASARKRDNPSGNEGVQTYPISEESPPLLRRSRRIAEKSENRGGNAVLPLEERGGESVIDLNEAFVNSDFEDIREPATHQANGTVKHEKTKTKTKKVRRQSSIVKSNKSRARTKRGGRKTRKDRSFDA